MRSKIRYLSVLRTVTKKNEEEVILQDGLTIGELLGSLIRKYGEELHYYLYDSREQLRGDIVILVNGRSIENLDGLDTKLLNNDIEIAFIPRMGGG